MTDAPVLSASETSAAEALLSGVRGTPVTVYAAEMIWDRSHIVRLRLADGHTVVLKRGRSEEGERLDRPPAFGAELAVLDFLSAMDAAVAPRLLAADTQAQILLMEDLGPSSSLAHSLLARDRDRAEADLIAYARALGAMHSWSIGRSAEFGEVLARRGLPAPEPGWLGAIGKGKERFLALTARLGLPGADASDEIDSLEVLLSGAGHVGLVHSDPCPDNTHIADGNCRIFDFETSGWGPVALDAAYLLAPFPSCWCFANLPPDVAGPALQAYRDVMTGAGVLLGAEWDAAITAALAGWVVARADAMGRALDEDRDWGTTTARPRLLTWLRSFIDASDRSGALPRLRLAAAAVLEELSSRWPGAAVPDYPALARPGAPLALIPGEWESS